MFGDGANRGPDYSADALHRSAVLMAEFHREAAAGETSAAAESAGVADRVRREIKANGYDPATGQARLAPSQVHALRGLEAHYREMFAGRGPEAWWGSWTWRRGIWIRRPDTCGAPRPSTRTRPFRASSWGKWKRCAGIGPPRSPINWRP